MPEKGALVTKIKKKPIENNCTPKTFLLKFN